MPSTLQAGLAWSRRPGGRSSRGGRRRSTTRVRGPRGGVDRRRADWKSRIASSIGIGMWSGASARTAASSAFGSSSGGRSSVRTTMRWLATPRRTRVGQVVLGEEASCSASVSAGGVGDLAVAQDARAQLGDGAALDGDVAVDARPRRRRGGWGRARARRPTGLFLRFRLSTMLVSARRHALERRLARTDRPLTTKRRARGPASYALKRELLTTSCCWRGSRPWCVGAGAGAGDDAVGGLGDRERVARSST